MVENRLMRRLEVAAYLGIGSSTLYRWIDDGLVPGPIQGTERWDRTAIDAALDKLSGLKNGAHHDDFAARRDRWKKDRQKKTG
jgi:excisionase family DNA binding protein